MMMPGASVGVALLGLLLVVVAVLPLVTDMWSNPNPNPDPDPDPNPNPSPNPNPNPNPEQVTDMWSSASWSRNPAPLYLMLPMLAFAVLFCGIGIGL